MTKEELIKKLEELRDVKNYSHYELTNKGYREGLLDALDLVNKYFDLALVSGRSELLNDSLQDQIKRGELDPYSPHAKWIKP
jgi:hypothetical protein